MADFGYSSNEPIGNNGGTGDKTDLNTGNVDTTGVGGNGVATELVAPDLNTNEGDKTNEGNGTPNTNGTNTSTTTEPDKTGNNDIEIVSGMVLEIDENKYTVDANGNLLNDKGEIFKEAKDVKEFIKTFDTVDTNEKDININTIKSVLGVDIVNDNGEPVEFDNTPEGVKSYINAVIEQQQEEYAQAGVNQLLDRYPIVQDVINYYVANGESLEGFGELKDRSNITIDEKNTAQQEAIIRESFKEFNKGGDVESYIQYLKDSGKLFATSQVELQSLIAADNSEKERIAEQARLAAQEEQQRSETYWNGVNEVIKSKRIAGYEIPDTIIINKDGKKIAATPNDFFNYIYQVDEQGNSRYVEELSKLTPEQRRDDEILRAYLRFTGGSYSDLVNMAIKEKEVSTLRLKAIENNKKSIKIITTTTDRPTGSKIDVGYK